MKMVYLPSQFPAIPGISRLYPAGDPLVSRSYIQAANEQDTCEWTTIYTLDEIRSSYQQEFILPGSRTDRGHLL